MRPAPDILAQSLRPGTGCSAGSTAGNDAGTRCRQPVGLPSGLVPCADGAKQAAGGQPRGPGVPELERSESRIWMVCRRITGREKSCPPVILRQPENQVRGGRSRPGTCRAFQVLPPSRELRSPSVKRGQRVCPARTGQYYHLPGRLAGASRRQSGQRARYSSTMSRQQRGRAAPYPCSTGPRALLHGVQIRPRTHPCR